MTGKPRSAGRESNSTDTKNASMSMCKIGVSALADAEVNSSVAPGGAIGVAGECLARNRASFGMARRREEYTPAAGGRINELINQTDRTTQTCSSAANTTPSIIWALRGLRMWCPWRCADPAADVRNRESDARLASNAFADATRLSMAARTETRGTSSARERRHH